MNQIRSQIQRMIMLFALLSITACNITTQDGKELTDQEHVNEEQNNGGEQKKDDEEYYGVCSMELFDIVDEREFVRVIIDLVMEDYVPRSELNEEEWEEQRKAIIELQNEFLRVLEEYELKIEGIKKGSRPWLAMAIDEQALQFICKHELVETVTHDGLDSTQ